MIKHVIFDFDGVLCDSLAAATAALNQLRLQRFNALPEARTQDDMVTVYGGSLQTCMDEWLSKEDQRAFFDEHSAAMSKLATQLKPFPGIGRLLLSIGSEGSSIVSSAYGDAIKNVLGRDPEFDPRSIFRIAGRELRQTKTEKIRGILEARAIAADAAIYVGDLESDILYCRAVPLRIVSVTYGYHPRWHLARCGPDYLVDSVADLGRLLMRLTKQQCPKH